MHQRLPHLSQFPQPLLGSDFQVSWRIWLPSPHSFWSLPFCTAILLTPAAPIVVLTTCNVSTCPSRGADHLLSSASPPQLCGRFKSCKSYNIQQTAAAAMVLTSLAAFPPLKLFSPNRTKNPSIFLNPQYFFSCFKDVLQQSICTK